MNLSIREREIISDNYNAFIANFETPYIVKSQGFYVYKNKEEYEIGGSYVQYCYNIDYLNGWLYGAVQVNNKLLKSIK